MGRARSRKGQSPAGENAERRRDVATEIEQTLRTLILAAEDVDLRFIGYLLRMAQQEADSVASKRAK
jgi:hypothetical protein